MAISILYNALLSILKFIPNFVSRKNLIVTPTTSSNSSSCLSLQGVNIFIKSSTSADLFVLDPDTGITHESIVPYCAKGGILAYSNGLVFCKSKEAEERSICVYNPTNKSLQIIPPPVASENLQELVSDFGLSTVYNGDMLPDYRLVLVVLTTGWNSEAYYRVYESEKAAWTDKRNIDVGPRNIQWGSSSVVCGETIFWVSDCGEYIQGSKPFILGLCLQSGNAQIMHIPEQAMVTGTSHRYQIWITKYDEEALCMVQYDKSHDVLVLWEIKLVPFTRWKLLERISMAQRELENHENIYGFTLISKEFLALDMGSRIYMYDLRKKVLKKMWYLQLVVSWSTSELKIEN